MSSILPPKGVKRRSKRHTEAFEAGHAAETWAMLFLMLKGYRPLARRFKAAGGEIDLIMHRGQTLAFIEVKARASLSAGLIAVTNDKQQRMVRAARAFLAKTRVPSHITVRFDIIAINRYGALSHTPAAFTAALV
jgi:putative endonuclease